MIVTLCHKPSLPLLQDLCAQRVHFRGQAQVQVVGNFEENGWVACVKGSPQNQVTTGLTLKLELFIC